MSLFEYVAVFFAVVVGLAVSHLLSALSDLVEVRQRVRVYWVQVVWGAVVFLFQVQSWWGLWGLRTAEQWNFWAFLAVVLMLSTLYLLASFVLPKAPETGAIDLSDHYFGMRRIFFPVLAGNLLLSVLLNQLLFDTRWLSTHAVLPAVTAALAVIAAITRSRVYHGAFALFAAAGTIAFIVAGGLTLR